MNIKHDKVKVIHSGIELFWKKGYNSVGINEICEVTGMTKGAFYHKFKGKEQFLNETILTYGKINSDQINDFFKQNNKQSNYDKLLNFYSYLFFSALDLILKMYLIFRVRLYAVGYHFK